MDVVTDAEIESRRAYQRAWYAKNKEKQRLKTAKWREENPEYAKQYARETYAANKEAERARHAAYHAANKEAIAARKAAYRLENREKLDAKTLFWRRANPTLARQLSSAWQKANPQKVAENSAKRRAMKLRATPAWANEFFISEAYDLAAKRSTATGIDWHVDHIVPLRSPLVCGLHCEANIQVITGSENASKGNRHWPGMP